MTRTTKLTYVGIVLAGLLVAALLMFIPTTKASAVDEPCVPRDAWTEVIEHPAETHVVHHDAVVIEHPAVPDVTETIPGLWLNWSPNHEQGPFEGPPAYPTDPRGTWQHWGDYKDIPPGHAGPDGVYQQGNGNGSWFYRQAEKVIVITEGTDAWTEVVEEAYDETVVDKEAWTETIEHPAVVCVTPSETPSVPTETPTVTETPVVPVPPVVTATPVVPTPTPDDVQTPDVTPVPEKEDEPKPTPEKDKPQPVITTTIECVDGTPVTTVTKNGNVVSVNESGSCEGTKTVTISGFVKEEGL